jgi:hypothetical protein
MAAPRARARAAFTPGWYYQPELEVPKQSRLRGIGTKIGSRGVSQPELKPTPA